jgi:hypothetical protein
MPAPQPKPKAKPKTKPDLRAFKSKIAEAAALNELEIQVNPDTARLPVAAAAAVAAAPMTEPPIDRDPAKLDPAFRAKLQKVLEVLKAEGMPFKFHEGFRTIQRQQWLFGQGRPTAKPFGRPGSIVTQKNGTTNMSNHQGNGTAGSGCAADCYPLDKNGKVTLDAPQKVWKRYAEVAESQGLTAGFRWKQPHDPPHIELRK